MSKSSNVSRINIVNLPAVFTIGPKNDPDALYKYARLLTTDEKNRDELVIGIVEGETRVICATLTMEEIFKERKLFKENVLKNIADELGQFGMTIYNANVKELQDAPGSEYFKYLRLKSQEGAINKAKVDVARVRMLGNVGEKERVCETRKQTSKIEVLFTNSPKHVYLSKKRPFILQERMHKFRLWMQNMRLMFQWPQSKLLSGQLKRKLTSCKW